MPKKVYSGIDSLPRGTAPDRIVSGCAVLEGGAFRAVYGEGVLDALMEDGINMQTTVGVSAGAMNGMNYVSGQIGRAAGINLRHRYTRKYVGLPAWPANRGIIGFKFVFGEVPGVPTYDRDRFFDPRRRFIAAATDCRTGETAYLDRDSCSDIYRAVQASASMPYVSRPVKIDGVPYLDGGCSNKLAYRWALDQGFDHIVVVRTRPADWRYEVKEGHRLPYRFYHKYPELARSIAQSEAHYNESCDELDKLARQGRIFMINPSEDLHVGRLERDMEKLGQSYWMGYQDGKNSMEALRRYLEID